MYEKISLIFVLINLPIVFFYNYLIKFINIYDKADNIRKFHKNKVALSGGIFLIYNFSIFFVLDFLFFNYELLNLDFDTREFFSLYLGLILFFVIGLYDDKFNLGANKKLFLNFFVIIFLILLDDKLVIRELNFSFLEEKNIKKNDKIYNPTAVLSPLIKTIIKVIIVIKQINIMFFLENFESSFNNMKNRTIGKNLAV